MDFLLDFILHIDQYMVMIVRDYHAWTYAILFSIIFCETGLVVTPFLPGDSLLFVAGAISAAKFLEYFTENHKAWAHLDIAGVAFGDDEFAKSKHATAYGVHLLTKFIENLSH